MPSLANASVLGGVVVTLSGDSSGLKATVADAKIMVAAAERSLAIKVPVSFRLDQAVAGIGQLRTLCIAASTQLAIRIPVSFVQTGGAPALPGGGIPRISSPNQSQLPAPTQRLALPAPGQSSIDQPTGNYGTRGGFQSAEYGSQGVYSGGPREVLRGLGKRAAALGGDGGTEVPPAPSILERLSQGRTQLNEAATNPEKAFKVFSKIFKVLAAAEAIAGTAEAVVGTGKAIGLLAKGASEDKIGAARDEARSGVQSIPFVGGLIDKVGNAVGSGINYAVSGTKNLILGNGFKSDYQLADKAKEDATKNDEKTARIQQRAEILKAQNDEVKPIAQAGKLQLAQAGKTATQSGVLSAQENLRAYNEKFGEKGGTQDVREARGVLTKQIAEAQKQDAANVSAQYASTGAQIAAARGSGQVASIQQGAIVAHRAGDDEGAAVEQRKAGRLALTNQQNQTIGAAQTDVDTLRNTGADATQIQNATLKVSAQKKAAAVELATFDEQTQSETEDRKRRKAIDSETAIASKKEASLRISKNLYQADLAAFDSGAKAKLDSITDVTDKANESTRLQAQRSVLVAQQQEQIALNTSRVTSEARSTTLRVNFEANKAELADFDENTKQILAKTDERERKAVTSARAQERSAIVQNQKQNRENLNASLDTRAAQAKAAGNNEGQLAGVIGTISGFKSELRNAQKEDRGKIASTQTAELESIQKQILRPRQYASEFDVGREAVGGAGGETGKEMVDILGLIRDYLKIIKDKPAGGLPA